MKISVIMAAYNSQATIARAVESFLAQDHVDKELIVVDGASHDQTCDIVECFDSPLIRMHSEHDRGIYDALNKGLDRASGSVIGLLHSNDVFANSSVLSDVAQYMTNGHLDAVYADVKFFPEDNPSRTIRHYRSNRFAPAMLKYGIMPAHPTLFLRDSVFRDYGKYRTDLKIASDFEFVARIFKDSSLNALYVPETWTRMQAGGASTSGLRSKVQLNSEIIQACRMHNISTSWLTILLKYSWKIAEIFPMLRGNKQ